MTGAVRQALGGSALDAKIDQLANAEAADRLSRHIADVIARVIRDRPEDQQAVLGTILVRRLIDTLGDDTPERETRPMAGSCARCTNAVPPVGAVPSNAPSPLYSTPRC